MREIEARYARGRSVYLMVVAGSFAAATLWFELDVALLVFGVIAGLLALPRLVDRRVKLRADASGLRYQRFGPRTFPWSEFAGFQVQTLQGSTLLVLTPRDAQRVEGQRPWYRRTAWLAWDRGALMIRVDELDLPVEQLVAVLEQHIDTTAGRTARVAHAAAGTDPLDVVLPAAKARMPARCLGCGAEPTGIARIEARRGVELGWFSVQTSAGILAPTCSACRWKRRLLALVLVPVPFAVAWFVVYVMVRTGLWPDDATPWWMGYALIGGLLGVLHAGLRRIAPVADRLIWGVHGVRLAKDHQTVVLRVQSATLRSELLALNRPTGAP